MKMKSNYILVIIIIILVLTSCNSTKLNINQSQTQSSQNDASVNSSNLSSGGISKVSSSTFISSAKSKSKNSSINISSLSGSNNQTSSEIASDAYADSQNIQVNLKTKIVPIGNNKTIQREVETKGYYLEIPPNLLTINGKTRAYIISGWTGVFDFNSGANLLTQSNAFNLNSRVMASSSLINNFGNPSWNPVTIENNNAYWSRNYYGVYSSFVAKDNTNREYIVGIMHGENKNERFNINGGVKYNNTVFPKNRTYLDSEYDGPDANGQYQGNWGTYFAFAGVTICPVSTNNGNDLQKTGDLGPIIWPARGYLNERGEQASMGIRHATAFINNNFIYVYYLDTTIDSYKIGQEAGIKVARAPLSSLGSPGNFKNYFQGSFTKDSLPSGFSKDDATMFYKEGNLGTVVVPGKVVRFSVAKAKGTDFFLGVEETFADNTLAIRLRASKDLVNWSKPTVVKSVQGSNWYDGNLHYPVFYDKNFTQNMEVDPEEFYIGGVYGSGTSSPYFQYVKIGVEILG